MKLRYWSQIHAKYPSLTPGWQRGNDNIVFSNPQFGTIVHIAVCDDRGKPLYDQPAWSEPPGAIIVPVDETGRIVFIENFRSVPPVVGSHSIYPPSDLSRQGRTSLELPRGFPLPGESTEDAAKREVEEETGCQVKKLVPLGESNTNTTFFLNNIPVWLANVVLMDSASPSSDPLESIERVRVLEMKEVMACVNSGQIICSLTKSALLHYLAWLQ